MANEIELGAAMRQNLLSLQNTQKSIDVTQLRLATGKKVNSALDNPQSFFQAQGLNNRAADLTRLLDGIGQSIRTIEEADKGVTALSNLINQASSIADSAQSAIKAADGFVSVTGTTDLRGKNLTDTGTGIANTNTFTITIKDDDINTGTAKTATITVASNDDVYDIAAKINDASNNSANKTDWTDNVRASVDSNGRLKIESKEEGAMLRIASGSIGAQGMATLGLQDYVSTESTVATTRQGGTLITGNLLTSAKAADTAKDTTSGKYLSSKTLDDADFIANGDNVDLTLKVGTDSVTFTAVAAADTIQSLIDKINISAVGDKVTASFNETSGKIELQFADGVSSASWTVEGNTAADNVSFGFGTGAGDSANLATIADKAQENFTFVGTNVDLGQYTKDFNKVREQIDGIVKDANYRGVNLLGGDTLTTFFNEDRTSSLDTEGQDLSSVGLGLDKANFVDAEDVSKALNQVDNALGIVRAFGTSIANDLSIIQTREDFTNQTITTLKAGASDLTDADLNEEGANLLALQTAQQLGVTSLSLASQSQQSVLRLF